MDLDLLRILRGVVKEGSFAAFARQHNMDPSLISRGISRLEKELGVRLFHRTTRRLTLSEAGAVYAARVFPLLEELELAEEAAQSVSAVPQGCLRLSVSNAYGECRLLPHLKEFRALYPDIELDIVFSDDTIDLAYEAVDLAIRLAPEIDRNVICTRLHETCYRVVAHPGFVPEFKEVKDPSELSNHDVIRLKLDGYMSHWRFRRPQGDELEVPIKGNILLNSPMGVKKAMQEGLGPALLATWMIEDELADGTCVDLFPEYEVTAVSFETSAWLIYLNKEYQPAKTRVMIDFLKQRLNSG